ncbi:MAG: DUF2490 domain-containing protein [Bacteroidales bacterium]
MMRMIRKIAAFLILISTSGVIAGQENDFGIWLELNTTHKIVKKLDATLNGEVRTFNNSSQVRQVFLEGGLEYKVTKSFSVAGSYRLASRREDDDNFYWRHRIFTDLKLKYPVNDFNISARLRFQRSTKTYIEDLEDLDASYLFRVRLKIDYDIPKVPLAPYVYYESFSPIFAGEGYRISKYRLSAGAEYHLTKKSDIQAGYIFQHDSDPKIKNTNILSLGYAVKF